MVQTTIRAFTMILTLFILKREKVIWTHAGQQNRLLERLERTAQETPQTQIDRKQQYETKDCTFGAILSHFEQSTKHS